LLLHTGLAAEFYVSIALAIPRLIGCENAALDRARERFDAILEHAAQQCGSIKFQIFVGHTFESKQPAKRFLQMIQREA